jgi:hypothetical protein
VLTFSTHGAGVNPRRRRDSVVVSQVQDETIVYDLTRHKAHCLNPTAALIWRYCDGETTIPEMTRRLGDHLGTGLGDELIWRALDQLHKAHLLEERIELPTGARGLSRRDLLSRWSLAAAMLPIVVSLVVPTAAIASHTCIQPCIPSNGCRAGIDNCKCCGPPACTRKCDPNGTCSNAVPGC